MWGQHRQAGAREHSRQRERHRRGEAGRRSHTVCACRARGRLQRQVFSSPLEARQHTTSGMISKAKCIAFMAAGGASLKKRSRRAGHGRGATGIRARGLHALLVCTHCSRNNWGENGRGAGGAANVSVGGKCEAGACIPQAAAGEAQQGAGGQGERRGGESTLFPPRPERPPCAPAAGAQEQGGRACCSICDRAEIRACAARTSCVHPPARPCGGCDAGHQVQAKRSHVGGPGTPTQGAGRGASPDLQNTRSPRCMQSAVRLSFVRLSARVCLRPSAPADAGRAPPAALKSELSKETRRAARRQRRRGGHQPSHRRRAAGAAWSGVLPSQP